MTENAHFQVPERTPPTERCFTTLGVDGDHWEYWSEITRTAFVAMRATAARAGTTTFDASAVSREIAGVRVTTMSADAHEVERTSALVRRAEAEDFFLTLIIEGTASVRQDDRFARLGPGDFFLLDSSRPYAFRSEEPYRSVVLQIPRHMLTSRCAAVERATATTFTGSAGLGAFVSPVLRALAVEGGRLDAASAQSLIPNVVDLLATAIDAPSASYDAVGPAAHRRNLKRAKTYLSHKLHDRELTLLTASHDLGLSLRYLHQLFHEAGTTPQVWLYSERLDRAHELLLKAGHESLTITEIALRVGFKDPSHFSRAFRARFGSSPGVVRRTARPGSSPESAAS